MKLKILTLLLLLPFVAVAQKNEKPIFNIGVKVGFNAASYNSTDFEIDGYSYDDGMIQSNRIGYLITPFVRLSKNRSYVQSELVIGLSYHNFKFIETSAGTQESVPQNAEYKLTTYCIQIPLLYGYEFVKTDTYGMSVFTGPKAKFVFTSQARQKFKNFNIPDLEEDLTPINYYWQIGLGVRISHVFFDFTYDFGLNNSTKGIKSNSLGKRFDAKRSDNVLSFSVGVIF